MSAATLVVSWYPRYGKLNVMLAGPRITAGMAKTGMRPQRIELVLVVGQPTEVAPTVTGKARTEIVTEGKAEIAATREAEGGAEIDGVVAQAAAAAERPGGDGSEDGHRQKAQAASRTVSRVRQTLTAMPAPAAARTADLAANAGGASDLPLCSQLTFRLMISLLHTA